MLSLVVYLFCRHSHNLYICITLQVSKVAYNHGMVVSTCKHCKNKHLIADNEGKMDMAQYGKKIEEFLESKGEVIQRLSVSPKDLEDNYLIDKDGVITLVPKIGGQVVSFLYSPLFFLLFPFSFLHLIFYFLASHMLLFILSAHKSNGPLYSTANCLSICSFCSLL